MRSVRAAVVVAGHGPGRGRDRDNYDALFAVLARRHPEWAARIRPWRTGTPPPALDDAAAVVFLLADPLRELYPECHAEASQLAADAAARGLRTVNPPDALSRTIKSRQAALWTDAGIPTPRVVGFQDADGLRTAAGVVGLPALVRADRLHSHAGTAVLRSQADVEELATTPFPYPGAVAEFVDTRRGHPRGLLSRWHHKKRAFVFGEEVKTHHLLVSGDPVVSLRGSAFHVDAEAGSTSLPARWRRRRTWRGAVAADLAYFRSEEPRAGVLRHAVRALGLDFAAVDYATRGDGEVVLWEANPFFRFPTGVHGTLPGPRRLAERVAVYCDRFARFLEWTLQPPP